VIKKGFPYEIISESGIWMGMLKKGNMMAYTCDEEIFTVSVRQIPSLFRYNPLWNSVERRIKKNISMSPEYYFTPAEY
jgi:membrane protease subunit (stomatin/prohibitin family)